MGRPMVFYSGHSPVLSNEIVHDLLMFHADLGKVYSLSVIPCPYHHTDRFNAERGLGQ